MFHIISKQLYQERLQPNWEAHCDRLEKIFLPLDDGNHPEMGKSDLFPPNNIPQFGLNIFEGKLKI